ncbi:P68 family surface lipoprotein [Mycoplasma sp. 'Moose RK']|uniref:P68 family surface lipoprotein n=1 Tax=Mycoplasma sp. 'Moose RK' TaxID=2780095 RepID=UPI0018C2C65A|nr:P80 family lipoprotein [Mycoplasma sp. 'Moose RK']MBG0730896.1 P80 family lipoprotein [Mycoplasma sp. 'Moose RK']
MKKSQNFIKKIRKTTLLLVPFVSLPFFVSCIINDKKNFPSQKENPNRYDTEVDESIDFRAIFPISDQRTKALKQIFEKWNKKPEVINKQSGFLPAKLDSVLNNYTKDQNFLESFLVARENKKIPNLTLNYPALAATVNKYGMLLDFNDSPELEKKINQIYDEKVLFETKNLPEIAPERIPFLPILKTSKVLLIDKPVLAYILEGAKTAKNFKIVESDKAKVEALDQNKTDFEYIKKVWGEYKNPSPGEDGFENYTFSFDKLTNFQELSDFIIRVKKSFPNAGKGDATQQVNFMLGINDPASTFFFATFAEANADYSKSTYFREQDGKSLNYNSLFDKSSENYKNAKKAFDIFASLFKNNLVGPTNPYKKASDYLKNHQLIFAITSTSNYTRNFDEKGQTFLRLKSGSENLDYPVGSKSKIWKVVSDSNLPANAIARIHQILDNTPGYIFTSGQPVVASGREIDSKNSIYLDPNTDKDLIDAIKESINTNNEIDPNNFSFLAEDPDFEKWLADQKTKSKLQESEFAFLQKDFKKNDSKSFKLIKKSEKVSIFSNSDQKLNEHELMILPEPTKLQQSNKFEVITSQGPSLIGFHNNDIEDKATLNFVKWFVSEKQEFTTQKNEKITITPSDFLALSAANFNPTKENLQSDFETNPAIPKSKILKTAFDEFHKQAQNPDKFKLFVEPASADSNIFREVVLTTLSQVNNNVKTDPTLDLNFDYFLSKLKNNIGVRLKINTEKSAEKPA